MNWSDYSRFVGDIFGAPLAVEGLLAFFLESTFLGLWIFGWDRLPSQLHLATIWLASIGTSSVGLLHPGCQLVHVAPGGLCLQPDDEPGRDGRLPVPVLFQSTTLDHVRARDLLLSWWPDSSSAVSPAWMLLVGKSPEVVRFHPRWA